MMNRYDSWKRLVTYGDETAFTIDAKGRKSKTKTRLDEVGAAHRYLTRALEGQDSEKMETCSELKSNLENATFMVRNFAFPLKKMNYGPKSAIALRINESTDHRDNM